MQLALIILNVAEAVLWAGLAVYIWRKGGKK